MSIFGNKSNYSSKISECRKYINKTELSFAALYAAMGIICSTLGYGIVSSLNDAEKYPLINKKNAYSENIRNVSIDDMLKTASVRKKTVDYMTKIDSINALPEYNLECDKYAKAHDISTYMPSAGIGAVCGIAVLVGINASEKKRKKKSKEE